MPAIATSNNESNYYHRDIVLEADMETVKLRSHIGADGILQISSAH